LDTIRLTETPEGIELSLRLAGPSIRAFAWIIDFTVRLFIVALLFIPIAVMGYLGYMGIGFLLMIWFALEWGYPVLFEVKAHGATPGKKILGLRVIHDDGSPIGWSAAISRNLLRAADFLPICYGFGLVTMIFHPDYKRLGDLAANTLVIYCEKAPSQRPMPNTKPIAPTTAMSLPEQHSIIHFAERSSQLSQERQEELANILSPLTHATPQNTDAKHAVNTLFGIARWLMGSKV